MDDGLATGVTARAACTAIRAAGAARVVLAVPVGSAHTVSELQQEGIADVVVCLRTPQRFRAVGAHYLVSGGVLLALSTGYCHVCGYRCQGSRQDPLTCKLASVPVVVFQSRPPFAAVARVD